MTATPASPAVNVFRLATSEERSKGTVRWLGKQITHTCELCGMGVDKGRGPSVLSHGRKHVRAGDAVELKGSGKRPAYRFLMTEVAAVRLGLVVKSAADTRRAEALAEVVPTLTPDEEDVVEAGRSMLTRSRVNANGLHNSNLNRTPVERVALKRLVDANLMYADAGRHSLTESGKTVADLLVLFDPAKVPGPRVTLAALFALPR